MSIDTTSLAEPMASILDTFAGVNAIRKLEVPLAPRDQYRDALIEFFECRAERTDENGHVLIRVDAVADLILDNQELAALIRPELIRSATQTGRSNDAHRTRTP